jgi:hypothetical protein
MSDILAVSAAQLRRAANIRERIEQLEKELLAILGGKSTGSGGRAKASAAESAPATKKKRRKKRSMSPEARERIAAAQRKRWAKHKKQSPKKAK